MAEGLPFRINQLYRLTAIHLQQAMFTRYEANWNWLLLAGKLAEKMTTQAIRNTFGSTLLKINAVLSDSCNDNPEDRHGRREV